MSMISVDYDVLNQRGSPAWFSDVYANIPTAGYKGRMFISTDTYAFYRDTGTGWDLIGGPGTGTITGSGASGQVSYFNGSSTLAGSNNLFWDITNSRLGIGTTTPGQPLDIHSTGNTLVQLNNTTTANSNISFQNQNVAKWRVGNVYNAGANSFNIENAGLLTNALTISSTTNNITLTGALSVPTLSVTNASTLDGNILLKKAGIAVTATTYVSQFAQSSGVGIGYSDGTGGANFTFPTASISTYTFPASTGTIALTSNLSSYLPLAGGIMTGSILLNNNLTISGQLLATSSYASMLAMSPSNKVLIDNNGQGVLFGGTIGQGAYTYNLPTASGTLALTSSLSGYLPLTGGTLTGDLSIAYTTTNLRFFLNNTTATTGRNWYFNSYSNGNLYVGNTTAGDIFNFSSTGAATFNSSITPGGIIYGINGNLDPTTGTNAGTTLTYNNFSAINNYSTGLAAIRNGAYDIFFQTGAANGGGYRFYIGTSEKMTMSKTGNVLVGTTTDTGNGILQVNGTIQALSSGGNIRLTGAITDGGLFTSGGNTLFLSDWNTATKGLYINLVTGVTTISTLGTGTVTATSGVLSVVSDMNLKIEDGYIDNALDKVMNLKPRYYHWKKESGLPTNIRQLGFYAQEVNQALGEEVVNTPKNENDKWGIYDRGMIAMLTKSIQELNDKLVRNNIN